jgi:hypothetical protein
MLALFISGGGAEKEKDFQVLRKNNACKTPKLAPI